MYFWCNVERTFIKAFIFFHLILDVEIKTKYVLYSTLDHVATFHILAPNESKKLLLNFGKINCIILSCLVNGENQRM